MPRSYHVYVGCSFPLLDHSTCVTRAKFAFPVRRHHSLRTVAKIILVLVLMEQHKNILHTEVTILWRHTNLFIIFFNLFLFYFIYLFFVFMYVRNGYDRNSETVNMLARHTALKRWIATEICWYKNVVSRGSAVQSIALLPISAMRLWAASDKGPRISTTTGNYYYSITALATSLSACVSSCKIPSNYWSEIDRARPEYVLWCPLKVSTFRWDITIGAALAGKNTSSE